MGRLLNERRNRSHWGVETRVDEETFDAFCRRQLSRSRWTSSQIVQRYRLRMLEHAKFQMDREVMETRGLPQPWARNSRDGAR